MNKLTEKTDYTPLPWMPQPVEFEALEKDVEVDYDFSSDIGGYDGVKVCTYVTRALVLWEDDSTTEVVTEELAYLFPRDQWEEWDTIIVEE